VKKVFEIPIQKEKLRVRSAKFLFAGKLCWLYRNLLFGFEFFPELSGHFCNEVFSIKWLRHFRFNPRRQRGQIEGGGGVGGWKGGGGGGEALLISGRRKIRLE
jgi:hypothetical protein